VAELPLTLLIRKHPEWVGRPVALVDKNTPQGLILAVNRRAGEQRIRTGMRYAAGMAIDRDLVAEPIPQSELEAAVGVLASELRRFTSALEPGAPGLFWLDADGLEWLYPDLEHWASEVRSHLWGLGYGASVGVASTRFGSFCLARERRAVGGGLAVVLNRAEEQARVRAAALGWLCDLQRLRDDLERLGVTTVAELLELPPSGVLARFGPEAYRLHRLASLSFDPVLEPEHPSEPVRRRLDFEPPETDSQRLLFRIKGELSGMLTELSSRGEALARLHLRFGLEGGGGRQEAVAPAEPGLDEALLLDLVRLRLETIALSPMVDLDLLASGVRAPAEQIALFQEKPRRDLRAANRALARVRAELGEEAVLRARSAEAHLPEAAFRWEPLPELGPARPEPASGRPLARVRRIFERSAPLPIDLEEELPERIAGGPLAPVEEAPPAKARWQGPFEVSGGWWQGEVVRRYHYAERPDGSLPWVFFDVARRRWRIQGRVE
jgi:protein ImuB